MQNKTLQEPRLHSILKFPIEMPIFELSFAFIYPVYQIHQVLIANLFELRNHVILVNMVGLLIPVYILYRCQ